MSAFKYPQLLVYVDFYPFKILILCLAMSILIFIDTNIYLDFYRARGGDASLSLLNHFDSNRDRIITTSEVEMEYKKNRQRAILESLGNLKQPDFSNLTVPAFFRESKRNQTITRTQKSLSEQIFKLKSRTAKLLESPARNDQVYMVLQRLFKSKGDSHLTRAKEERFAIRELANKRFILGYPPRKPSDTSIVDAINWEWIVYCAQHCSSDIVIVSRDSDYGIHYSDKSILNDWLSLEFKERVSHKRSITLTNRLTEAFKQASIEVSQEEENAEESLIQSTKNQTDFYNLKLDTQLFETIDKKVLQSILSEVIKEFVADENRPQISEVVLKRPEENNDEL
jgi:hypothetical protein